MGICLSSDKGASIASATRSNKIRDISSFTTKDNQQSTTTERKPTFQVSRDEAESILANAKEGEFLLSHDISSERFVSVCSGQFVSHHPIYTVSNGISVGGEYFETLLEMLEYYKEHELGKTKLESEYTATQTSVKKTSNSHKGTSSKSSSSWQMNSMSSPEHFSESSEYRSTRRMENLMSEIRPLPEEEMKSVHEAVNPDVPARRESHRKTSASSNGSAHAASVSSAGYQDLPLDEPMPILPANTGERPPPLFKGISSKSLSSLGFQSYRHSLRMNAKRFSVVEQNDKGNACMSTKMIKIAVSGKADTMIEQDYLIKECLPSLSEFCNDFGFVCDIVHLSSKQNKLPGKNWAFQDKSMGLPLREIDEMKLFGMPVIMLGCFGEKTGPLIIPREISAQDFDKILDLLDKTVAARLSELYEKDENDCARSFVLKENVEENSEVVEELVGICDKLLHKCFEGEKFLWTYFQPDLERHLKCLISHFKDITLIPIERKITDLRKCARSWSTVEAYEDSQDANSYYHLESMRNESRLGMMGDANLRATDVVSVITTLSAIKHDSQERMAYVNTLKETLMPHIKRKLLDVMRKYPSVESDYSYLRNEIYTHLFECKRKCTEFVGNADVLQTIKAYVQGPYQKPLILHGESGCGRSSIIAKSSTMTKEWVGAGVSIVTRLIGSTRDSTSLHLLLQSICLQLSFAYKTDPGVVPKCLSGLVQFLPSLFQFATESQPLVIFIAGIDNLKVFDDEFGYFCFVPPILLKNVKIVLSMHKRNLSLAKTLYTDANSYRELLAKTPQDGIEMLDSMLVDADRTLSEQQKNAVLNSLTSCWSPVYVNILFHKAKSWRGNELVSLPSKVDLKKYINDLFSEVETSNGYESVALISSLISVSKFGISKRCLTFALLQDCGGNLSPHQALHSVSKVIASLSNLLNSRWLNGQVVCTWFHKSIEKVAKERYLREESSVRRLTKKLVDYYKQEPNSFEPVHDDKNVMIQPVDSANVFRKVPCPSGHSREPQLRNYNLQKLQFLPFYLLQCYEMAELKSLTICNYQFLYQKLRATSLGHILNDFYHALTVGPGHLELKIMLEFFELSTDAFTFDPDQFPAQIFSRLHPLKVQLSITTQNYGSVVEKGSLPPPDGKDSSSPEDNIHIEAPVGTIGSNQTDKNDGSNENNSGPDSNNHEDGASEISPNGAVGTKCDFVPHDNANTIRESFVLTSPALITLINCATEVGHLLMPSSPCLVRPASECGEFAETQVAEFSKHPLDARIIFMDKDPNTFMAWSRNKESIGLYDSRCTCLNLYTCHKLGRVLLALNDSAVVELQDSTVWLFDLTNCAFVYELQSGQRYFAVCDSSHIAALSDNLSCLSVYNTRSRRVVWDFSAPEGRSFHNVLVSKNGAIGVCILEANSVGSSRNELSFDEEECHNSSSTQDEIIVVNLKSRQQLHSISLRNGQYLHKICSISEDGHYLVHLTEPDHQILVLDLIKGNLVREIEARLHRILKLMVSTQGNCILSASADSILRVWNLSDGELRYSLFEPIRSIRGGYMDDKHCLGMSEDGSRAIHSVRSQFHCSYVVLWDLVQGKQLATFTTDFYGLSYEISPCGDYIVTSMPSGLVTMGSYKAMKLDCRTADSIKNEEEN